MSFDRNLAIIGFVVSLFSVAFAIWTYVETRQFSQITYSISQDTLFRPSKAIDTTLSLSPNTTPITGRVTQTVITIWNGGNVPFKGEDTRSRLSILGDSSVSFLSHKVVLTKVLPGSEGFSVSGDDKHLEIDWRVFDPEEAIQIVILSTGNAESLYVSGRFLPGQNIVRYPVRSPLKSIALFMVFVGGGISFILLIGFSWNYIDGLTRYRIFNNMIKGLTFVIMLFFFVYIGYFVLRSARIYVGDLSPIDPDVSYIDTNRKLDYRYAPM